MGIPSGRCGGEVISVSHESSPSTCLRSASRVETTLALMAFRALGQELRGAIYNPAGVGRAPGGWKEEPAVFRIQLRGVSDSCQHL